MRLIRTLTNVTLAALHLAATVLIMVTIQREHLHWCDAHRITYPYPFPPETVDAGSVCDQPDWGEWGGLEVRPWP